MEPWCADFPHGAVYAYGGIRCHWHSVRTPWVRPPERQQGLHANAPTHNAELPARLQVALFLHQSPALPLCTRKVHDMLDSEVLDSTCRRKWSVLTPSFLPPARGSHAEANGAPTRNATAPPSVLGPRPWTKCEHTVARSTTAWIGRHLVSYSVTVLAPHVRTADAFHRSTAEDNCSSTSGIPGPVA